MTGETPLEAVRDLEHRITARLAELEQAGSPVEQAEAEAEALLEAARGSASLAAETRAAETAASVRREIHAIEQRAVRLSERLAESAAVRRVEDLRLIRSVVLPVEAD
ncbi:MAG: hypothetical protein ACRCYQ_04350 [Nocardioides sp.]